MNTFIMMMALPGYGCFSYIRRSSTHGALW
ncbi:hypothetical protein ABIC12_002958 [Pantoea agglomerans]|nr:hypothetical protein [Pantoea agglomerans]